MPIERIIECLPSIHQSVRFSLFDKENVELNIDCISGELNRLITTYNELKSLEKVVVKYFDLVDKIDSLMYQLTNQMEEGEVLKFKSDIVELEKSDYFGYNDNPFLNFWIPSSMEQC